MVPERYIESIIWGRHPGRSKALDGPSLSTGNREGPKLRLCLFSLSIQFLIPARKGHHQQWAGLPNLKQPNQDNTCSGSNLDYTNPRRYRPVFLGILDFVKVALTHTYTYWPLWDTLETPKAQKNPTFMRRKGPPTNRGNHGNAWRELTQ